PGSFHGPRYANEWLTATGERAREGEAATYFPSAVGVNDARVIPLEEGKDISGVTIVLRGRALRHVSGQVPKDAQIAAVTLDPTWSSGSVIQVLVNPDGSFERGGIPAGVYSLKFSNETTSLSGEARVDLTSGDAEDVRLESRKGFSLGVRIRLDGAPQAVQPVDGYLRIESIPAGFARAGRAVTNGDYVLPNIVAGKYRLQFLSGQASYFVKRVAIGG